MSVRSHKGLWKEGVGWRKEGEGGGARGREEGVPWRFEDEGAAVVRERRRKRVVSVEVVGERIAGVWGWLSEWVGEEDGRVDMNGNLDVEIGL